MAFTNEVETKEEISTKPDTSKAPHPAQVQANGVAVPTETMNKVLAILRKLPYDTVGELMDEIKREIVGANITKQ
jgi:hypothetical protein